MSSVAGGGSAAPKQSGTAPAAGAESISPPISTQYYSETKNTTSSTSIAAINQVVDAEHADNGNDSDVDSLFGDIAEFNEMLDGASKDADINSECPAKKDTHNHVTAGTKTGNAHQAPVEKTKATPGQLTLPSVPHLTLPTVATEKNNTELNQVAPIIANEETGASANPQHPPITPPRLTNIPMSGPPASRNIYGPEKHNDMPSKPNTPLANQLRSDFWNRNRQEKQALFDYKKSYKEWSLFTTAECNKTKPDYDSAAEQLKTSAITAQAAWAKAHQSFNTWKAENPAVSLIIANIHEDVKSIQADDQAKAERAEFIRDINSKGSAKDRQSELAQYDKFAYFMSESRERDQWRKRVATQIQVQTMLEAQHEAAVEEQNRTAVEAARKRTAAEAEQLRKKAAAAAGAERKKKEAEAKEQRKQAEAKAAEETRPAEERLAAVIAQPNEEERLRDETASAAEKLPDNGVFQNQSDSSGMTSTARAQEQAQQDASGQAVTTPVASSNTATAEDSITAGLQGLQTDSNNVQESEM